MKDNYNQQIIILETIEGTAKDEEQLRKVWIHRLKEVAPHYQVVGVKIKRGLGKPRGL